MTRESKDFSMREEEDGAKRIYASGMSSLFFEGILAATLAMLVGFVVSILENFDTRISVITAGTMLLGIFVIILRYTVVTVSDNELTVKYIGRKPITLARDAHGFSTLTEVKTYYLLPIWIACRTLLATDASGGTLPLTLHSFTGKELSLLMADLVRPTGTEKATVAKERFTAEFNTPKEAILLAHRKMMRITLAIFLGIGIVVAVLTGSPLASAIGCGLVYFCIRMIIGFEYRTVRRRMPARIVIDNDRILFDDDAYQFGEGMRITATPPSYPKNSSFVYRTLKIQGAWGERGKYCFSQCPNKNNGKYVFQEYGDMCDALERAAHIHNFVFLYDL